MRDEKVRECTEALITKLRRYCAISCDTDKESMDVYRDVIVNFAGNALFSIIREDKGIDAFKTESAKVILNLESWFATACADKEKQLSKEKKKCNKCDCEDSF